MIYVVVGFKVTQENSVYYAKVKTLDALCRAIKLAFEKGAEFISLRRIP